MDPDPRTRRGSARIRRRAIAVGVGVLMIGSSGVALDRGVGPLAPRPGRAQGLVSGSWFCPLGGHEGWKGWVVIANPGSEAVDVRVTSLGHQGVQRVEPLSIGPHALVYQEVPAGDPSASTQVEYFGGWVGAASVLRGGGVGAPGAAARCTDVPARAWALPDQRTGEGERSIVVVMNPFAEEASFDVVFRTERRSVRPKQLSPFVLRAHHSVGISVNDYLLMGPDERTVAAIVVPRVGRVVAGGVAFTGVELRAEVGASSARPRVFVPAAGYAGPGELLLINPQDAPEDLSVVTTGPTASRSVSGPDGLTLGPEEVRTLEVDALPDAGAVVEGADDSSVVAALKLSGEGSDGATIIGTPRSASSWLVLPTTPPSGGEAFLVLENPGNTTVRATVALFGPEGPLAAGLDSVPVAPGRTIQLPLPAAVGGEPAFAVITTEGGTVVVAGASYSRNGSGYATTLGIPMKS